MLCVVLRFPPDLLVVISHKSTAVEHEIKCEFQSNDPFEFSYSLSASHKRDILLGNSQSLPDCLDGGFISRFNCSVLDNALLEERLGDRVVDIVPCDAAGSSEVVPVPSEAWVLVLENGPQEVEVVCCGVEDVADRPHLYECVISQ